MAFARLALFWSLWIKTLRVSTTKHISDVCHAVSSELKTKNVAGISMAQIVKHVQVVQIPVAEMEYVMMGYKVVATALVPNLLQD
mgnify:CR=1 FL=1